MSEFIFTSHDEFTYEFAGINLKLIWIQLQICPIESALFFTVSDPEPQFRF